MKLYVTRHGQTQWNAENRVCGATNLPLNEAGEQQARQLAEKAADYQLDVVICSPMRRAVATAQTVAQRCGVPCLIDPRLYEQNFGLYEGVQRDDPSYQQAKQNLASRFPQGESIFQLVHRIYGFLEEIAVRYRGKRVLLVCHGVASRVIHSYFVDMTNQQFAACLLGNCEIREYEL